MSEPNEKDREAARQLVGGFTLECGPHLAPRIPEGTLTGLRTNIATALSDADAKAYARAKAEDAGIVRRHLSGDDVASRRLRESLTAAILTSASGPTYEQRIRAEITEAVGKLPRHGLVDFPDNSVSGAGRSMGQDSNGDYLDRDDVLAIIEGSEK